MGKRIMFVGASLGGGGSERVMTLLANAMYKQGNEINIIRLFDDKVDYTVEIGIDSTYIGNSINNPIIKKLDLAWKLRKIIKKYHPDTIISFLTTCNVISIISSIGINCKVIISERNDPNNNVGSKLAAHLRNIAYSVSDKLVCQTPDAVKYFPKKIQKKAVVIPNPINESLPEPYNGIRKKNIVMVCRLNKQKNLPMALNVFEEFYKKHPEWKLDIYGEGEEKDRLLSMVEKLNSKNSIEFHGFANNVIEQIYDSGIYLSTSDYEGISNSMLEALAIGIPCVVTDCPIGGARMIIKNNENGVLIPINNVPACVDALVSVTEDLNLQMKIISNSVLVRNKYSMKKIIELWNKQIQDCDQKDIKNYEESQ